ncbi:helix-hairpin-helix domain-containing protein [Nocardioides sp.]|uniref:helix-hairpin-helix domain-containing protein n=1 Tax=Nocardioides sp. TaxID=35761 RepID=UPI003519307A
MPLRRTSADAADHGGSGSRAELARRRLALIAADLDTLRAAPPPVDEPAAPDHGDADTVHEPWWVDHTCVVQRVEADLPPPLPLPTQAPGLPGPPRTAPASATSPDRVAELPRPGRHAARRAAEEPRRRVAAALEPLTSRRLPGIGGPHLAVVAIAVVLAAAVTGWWVLRDRPSVELARPMAGEASSAPALVSGLDSTAAPAPASSAGGAARPATSPSAAGGGSVTVDVAGKVRRPGIVVLDAGARVTDALKAAGGARSGVDLTPLNLARVLVDGEQIVVGVAPPRAAAGSGGVGATPGAPGATGPLVNLNSATQAELEGLPGVGPVTATAILAWRDQHGGFSRLEELLEVDGIGDKTLARLAPHLTV